MHIHTKKKKKKDTVNLRVLFLRVVCLTPFCTTAVVLGPGIGQKSAWKSGREEKKWLNVAFAFGLMTVWCLIRVGLSSVCCLVHATKELSCWVRPSRCRRLTGAS